MNYLQIRNCGPNDEPMCATSEAGERLYSRDEMRSVGFDVGQRILELFGHQGVSNMVFRLKSTGCEVRAILNGEQLPSIKFLLALRDQTGVSIDWLLTGTGPKFLMARPDPAPASDQQRREAPTVIAFPAAVVEPIAA